MILTYETLDWDRNWFVDSSAGKTQLFSFVQSNNTGAIDVEMNGSILEEKTFVRCWGCFSLVSWNGALTLSLLLKLPPRKLELQFVLQSFFLLRLLFISIKCTIRFYMEYCCHVWSGAPRCYLELLDKLEKWICRIIGSSLPAPLEPFAHRRNVASLSLFYRYYFGRCSSELAQLVPLPYFSGRSTCYSDMLHDFSVTILDVIRMSMPTVSFLA